MRKREGTAVEVTLKGQKGGNDKYSKIKHDAYYRDLKQRLRE